MNVQEAKTIAAGLNAKIAEGGTLSNEELQQREEAANVLLAAAEAKNPGSAEAVRTQVYERLDNATPSGKVKFMGVAMSPTVKMIAMAVSYVAVGAASAFGGMKYEQRREARRNTTNSDSTQHSDSPQSHPATSPLDGRHFNHAGNPGNAGNQTNHPGPAAGGRTRSTANA